MVPPRVRSERDRDRHGRAERQGQEHAGQAVGGQARRLLAGHRLAEPAAYVELYGSPGQGEPAQHGQAR